MVGAVNPTLWRALPRHNGGSGFLLVLGAVFLVATGGEALYADLGPLRREADPDRLVLSSSRVSLVLNYLGQGALLLADAGAAAQSVLPARSEVGAPAVLIALATLATIIASQAMISGAFSLTRQAVQLGYLPRMEIIHTSGERDRPDLYSGGELAADAWRRSDW